MSLSHLSRPCRLTSPPPQELGLQPEDNFVLKVVQLEELLHVRHSIFVIGNAGTGKTKILRSLNKTYQIMKRKPVWQDLNPKAVTNDELFGYINPATREWKDGGSELSLESDFVIAYRTSGEWLSKILLQLSSNFSSMIFAFKK